MRVGREHGCHRKGEQQHGSQDGGHETLAHGERIPLSTPMECVIRGGKSATGPVVSTVPFPPGGVERRGTLVLVRRPGQY
jgi:hypothetical protein